MRNAMSINEFMSLDDASLCLPRSQVIMNIQYPLSKLITVYHDPVTLSSGDLLDSLDTSLSAVRYHRFSLLLNLLPPLSPECDTFLRCTLWSLHKHPICCRWRSWWCFTCFGPVKGYSLTSEQEVTWLLESLEARKCDTKILIMRAITLNSGHIFLFLAPSASCASLFHYICRVNRFIKNSCIFHRNVMRRFMFLRIFRWNYRDTCNSLQLLIDLDVNCFS